MPKVKNKKTINNLAIKSFAANGLRNILAILAIALTTIMLTSLFTIGSTILDATQQSTFRMVGTSSHGGFKYLTQEEYDVLSVHPDIKDISYSIPVAIADNPGLSKIAGEIRYSEEKDSKWSSSFPTTGTMPKQHSDLATSTAVLDALGIPHIIGQEVPLQFKVGEKEYSETFILSGFWEDDKVNAVQQIFLSREYVDSVIAIPTVSYTKQEKPNLFGTIAANVWFENPLNIEGKLVKVLKESGFTLEDIGIGVNWGYSGANLDIFAVLGVIGVLLVIMASGYLIIYNIFYISVTKDIRFYGLLKTVGTTGRQIKAIIRKQTAILCAIGIPLGMLVGYFIGAKLLPAIMSTTILKGETKPIVNVWVFVLSALFAIATVFISTRSPSKMASRVSPIEALRSADISVSTKRKTRKTKKVTIPSIAVKNVFRNKKKLLSVIISLSLSIVLTLSIYTAIQGFDMDIYLSNLSVADFTVTHSRLKTRYVVDYVDNNALEELSEIPGVEGIGAVYMTETIHELSDKAKNNHEETEKEELSENPELTGTEVPSHVYGIDPMLYEKIAYLDGAKFDERFLTGDYVYLIPEFPHETEAIGYYSAGDTVSISFVDGKEKEYTVLGYVTIPYPLSIMHYHGNTAEFVLPSSEYLTYAPQNGPIHIALDVDDAMEAAAEKTISAYSEANNLSYVSKAVLVEDFRGFQSMYVIVGGTLVAILALIGLLNVINSMLTSIITRRVELATLQSIGMTGKDVGKMLVLEGLTHAGLVMLIVLTIGQLFTYQFTELIAGASWFFSYSLELLPLVVCIPVLILVCFLVPIIAFRNIGKESVVQRLRVAE